MNYVMRRPGFTKPNRSLATENSTMTCTNQIGGLVVAPVNPVAVCVSRPSFCPQTSVVYIQVQPSQRN